MSKFRSIHCEWSFTETSLDRRNGVFFRPSIRPTERCQSKFRECRNRFRPKSRLEKKFAKTAKVPPSQILTELILGFCFGPQVELGPSLGPQIGGNLFPKDPQMAGDLFFEAAPSWQQLVCEPRRNFPPKKSLRTTAAPHGQGNAHPHENPLRLLI